MGGRGASSGSGASYAKGVNGYRITHGDRALGRLRKKGATDKDVSRIYSKYKQNRINGMGKRDARIAAEKSIIG